MNIILCGLMFSDKGMKEAYIYSKSNVQMAPHTFQTNLINGFSEINGVDVSVVNVMPVGSFPMNYRKLFLEKEKWGSKNVQIGYLNIPIIKQWQQIYHLVKEIEKKINFGDIEDNHIIIYHTYEPFMKAIRILKRKYPNINTSLIMTDCVPGRGDMEKYMTKRAIRKGNRIVKLAKNIDCFVLLTKYMAASLEIDDKPYTVVECICNENQKVCSQNKTSKNRCLYTGSIDKEFGMCDLAEAFSTMKNCELWICGDGSGKSYIEGLVKKSDNIKYLGFLKQDELAYYRNQCDFLINPRRPTGTFTKYSFPSKTAEYMMSGKPVIMYKLEGVPDEYDEYLNYLSAETPKQIKIELERIFKKEYSELVEKASRGKIYMQENKNSVSQARKIISILKKVNNDKYETEKP